MSIIQYICKHGRALAAAYARTGTLTMVVPSPGCRVRSGDRAWVVLGVSLHRECGLDGVYWTSGLWIALHILISHRRVRYPAREQRNVNVNRRQVGIAYLGLAAMGAREDK